MPRVLRPPPFKAFRRRKRLRLSKEQREQILATIIARDGNPEIRMAAIEQVVNQSPAAFYMFDTDKPAYARDGAKAILRRLRRGKIPTDIDWRLQGSLKLCGCEFDSTGQPTRRASLKVAAERVRTEAARWPSPRRPTMRARDNYLIPELCHLFARWEGEKSPYPVGRDFEYFDRLERFIAIVLKAARIPCPVVRDTRLNGEQSQGRLRRHLKRLAKRYFRNVSRQDATR